MNALQGQHLLLVEDDWSLAAALTEALEREGAEVIGPCADLRAALDRVGDAPRIDAALLDIDLGGVMSFPVADALRARDVPLLFLTVHDSALPATYDGVRRCRKPIGALELIEHLVAELRHRIDDAAATTH